MYPELAPRGADQATGLKAVLAPVLRRMQLYRPPYPGLRMGEIDEAELRREAEFLGLQIGNLKPIYTNSYADPINQFDMEKVIALAKQYPS
jgi:NitT/TauT family transport system substrate-binding protein